MAITLAALLAGGVVAMMAVEPSRLETPSGPQPTTWAWRQIVKRQVDATVAPLAAPRKEPDSSPILLHAAPDTDVVTMAPFRVNGNRVTNELRRMYARQDKQAKEDLIMRRLGIGVHTIGYKHFGAGVMTVFYIPVFAGFGFSW